MWELIALCLMGTTTINHWQQSAAQESAKVERKLCAPPHGMGATLITH